jgi:flagellin-like protein
MKSMRNISGICAVVIALMMTVSLSGCSITKSTRVHDEDGRVVESTSFRIGTPFGTLGAKDDEDDD